MVVDTYRKGNRRSDICKVDNHFVVRLYENNICVAIKELPGHSIHYAESLAENFVEQIGSFYPQDKQFLVE